MNEHDLYDRDENSAQLPEPVAGKAGRIISIILAPFVVVGMFLLSLYLMEFGTNPFITGTGGTTDAEKFEANTQIFSQAEPPAAPLTPVAASGGWDYVTAAKEKRYQPEMPRGYTPDVYSFRYKPKMFAPQVK